MTATKKRIKTQKIIIHPFEDSIHYHTMISYRWRGLNVGAYLLRRTPTSPWVLTFGFEAPGIHSFLAAEKFDQAFHQIEDGLKDLPQREKITFHLGAYKSDADRQAHLDQLIENAPCPEMQFLLYGEKARIRQLCREGLREPKSLYIFVTYSSNRASKHQDWFDIFWEKLDQTWTELAGKSKGVKQKSLEKILARAWADGYINWKQLLEGKLGLVRLRSLSSQEMWDYIWGRINTSVPIQVPQEIVVAREGLSEKVRSSRQGCTLLVADREPIAEREWVYVGGKYVGILTFWDKPGGWKDRRSQLHYLWDLVAKELVTDTEIFTQIVPANQKKVSWLTMQATKQSHNKASRAAAKIRELDLASSLKARTGREASEKILQGSVALYVATIILVRRDRLEELDEACSYIENCFHRPAWVRRERQITWKYWLQTLPIVDELMLTAGLIQNRQIYLNSEAMGFLPLVKTWSRDAEGLEVIGEDGGSPIFISLFSEKHRHLFVVGTTRSGKSVIVAGLLNHALVRNIPVVAIDYPKPDGSSTYTTYTHFLEERGAYFDVGKESLNMFDRPHLANLDPQKQKERFEDYKDFLCSCLVVMVVGESPDILLNQTVRTVLYQTLNTFFQEREILARYEAAEAAGLGSAPWQEMPTLIDFLGFVQKLAGENAFEPQPLALAGEGPTGAILPRALEQIVLRLRYWTTSRVGKAISSPSSVPTDATLMVLALRQISENEDAAVLSLVAYAAALRRAMAHPLSIFFIDESPILFKFPSVVRLVASIISNGAKSGVRVVLSAQDPDSIANSESGQQILQNINTRLIGKVQPSAIDSLEQILHYDRDLVGKCANFEPKLWGLYTPWMLDDSGVISFCRFYVPYNLLALVANNPDEQSVRDEFLQAYPDKYEAICQFSQALVESITAAQKLDQVKHKYLPPELGRVA